MAFYICLLCFAVWYIAKYFGISHVLSLLFYYLSLHFILKKIINSQIQNENEEGLTQQIIDFIENSPDLAEDIHEFKKKQVFKQKSFKEEQYMSYDEKEKFHDLLKSLKTMHDKNQKQATKERILQILKNYNDFSKTIK